MVKQNLHNLVNNIKEIAEQLSATSSNITPDFYAILSKMTEPEKIAEFVLSHLETKSHESQLLLECKNVDELLKGIYEELSKRVSQYLKSKNELERTHVSLLIKVNTNIIFANN